MALGSNRTESVWGRNLIGTLAFTVLITEFSLFDTIWNAFRVHASHEANSWISSNFRHLCLPGVPFLIYPTIFILIRIGFPQFFEIFFFVRDFFSRSLGKENRSKMEALYAKMAVAYEDMLEGNLSFRKCAELHKVSVSTFRRYYNKQQAAAKSAATTARNSHRGLGMAASVEGDDQSSQDARTIMQAACQAVQERGISARKAAREFNVPISTLNRHLRNPNIRKPGGMQKFSDEEEAEMEKILLDCSGWECPWARVCWERLCGAYGNAKGELNQSIKVMAFCFSEFRSIKQSSKRYNE